MFVQAILLVLTILIPGHYIRKELSPFNKEKVPILDKFVENLIIGTTVLIIPMLVIGVIVRDSLDQVVYLFFFFNGFIIILYLIQSLGRIKDLEKSWSYTNIQRTLQKLELIKESTHVYDVRQILIYTIVAIVSAITLLNFLMPPRGWDALHFYFPHARYYYVSDEIPAEPNYLNFLPAFKPPLNTLLFTYDNYLTSSFDSQLFPVAYLVGILIIAYLFGMELGYGSKFSFLVILHIITVPTFFMTFREYMYYQEFPVTFFYSATIFFFFKATKFFKNGSEEMKIKGKYFIKIGSMSASMAIASKISGFTILLAIFLLFPLFKSRRLNLILKVPVILGLVSFLLVKGFSENYIGTVIVVGIFSLLLLYQVLTEVKFEAVGLARYSWSVILPLLILALWVWQISRIDRASDFLYRLYFEILNLEINWNYTGIKFMAQVYVENAHSSSWFMSVFAIFFGSQLNGFMGFFRIVSIISILKNRKKSNLGFMLTWLIFFYTLWLTYFSDVSIRYLSIIWIPLAFISVDGMLRTYDFFVRPSKKFYSLLLNDPKYDILPKHIFVGFFLPIASSSLLFWPFVPFHLATQFYNIPLFAYHYNYLQTLVYIFAFNLFFIYVAVFVNDPVKINSILKVNLKNVKVPRKQVFLTNFLILFSLVGIFGPYMVESGLIAISGFDTIKYRENYIYDNREAVRDLFAEIQRLNFPSSDITIGLNLPGFEYYLNRPFIELQDLNALIVSKIDNSSIFYSNNADDVLREFINNDLRMLVAMTPSHIYYEVYEAFKDNYPFLQIIENNGVLLYENTEFRLYRVE